MMWYSSKTILFLLVVLLVISSEGCVGSLYDWQVRTNSTPVSAQFQPAYLQQPIAVLPAITGPGLRGNEFPLGYYLGYILKKTVPNWTVVTEVEVATRINRKGLAPDFTRMRNDYDLSGILDRDTLRKLAAAIDARYVFQPRLAAFSQTMTERWKFLDVRLFQTRSSNMRVSLQLWDAETGDLLWTSIAETVMSNDGVTQDPVYMEDIALATLGSIMVDFLQQRTASRYTPLNQFLGSLIKESTEKAKDPDVKPPAEAPKEPLGQ